MVSPSLTGRRRPERGETDRAPRASPSHAASPEAGPRSRPTARRVHDADEIADILKRNISTLQAATSALSHSLLQNLIQKGGYAANNNVKHEE